jgi:hypothetical protein
MKSEDQIHGQRKEQNHESKDQEHVSTTKEKKRETISERQHKTPYEEDIFTKEYNTMAKVLGLHLIEVFTFKRRTLKEKLQRS